LIRNYYGRMGKAATPEKPLQPTKSSDKPADSVKNDSGAKQRLQPANLTKGQSVSLRDGTGATVAHVIDDKSVRVRTEAGKNTVVKRAEVTPLVEVRSHYRKAPGS
jgi:sRNA-binding protein